MNSYMLVTLNAAGDTLYLAQVDEHSEKWDLNKKYALIITMDVATAKFDLLSSIAMRDAVSAVYIDSEFIITFMSPTGLKYLIDILYTDKDGIESCRWSTVRERAMIIPQFDINNDQILIELLSRKRVEAVHI